VHSTRLSLCDKHLRAPLPPHQMESRFAAPVSTPEKASRTRLRLETCSTALPTPTLGGEGRGRLLSEASDDITLPQACTDVTNPDEVHDCRSRTPPKTTAKTSRFRSPIRTHTAVVRSGFVSPPPKQRSGTPPPAPRRRSLPPLMRALQLNSMDNVQQVLDAASSAAQQPFWEHDCEPPLCCAARFACSPAIFMLLLQHGADVGAVDRRGRTPLGIISSEPRPVQPPPDMFTGGTDIVDHMDFFQVAKQQSLDIARLLIGASADMGHADLAGSTPLDHALRAQNQPLLQVMVDCGCQEAAEAAAALQGAEGLEGPLTTYSSRPWAPRLLPDRFLQ